MSELKLYVGQNNSFTYLSQHHHNPVLLDKELFYLATMFGGSKFISSFRLDNDVREGQIFFSFRNLEFSEITKTLISIAAIIRNLIQVSEISQKEAKQIIVGSLVSKKEKINLDLINSCHKILHCEHIGFDYRGRPQDIYSNYLTPKVYLYGSDSNGIDWKVTLDIKKFIEASYSFY